MSSVKDSILLKGTSAGGSAVATDLKLHWDTTQTSLVAQLVCLQL